MAAPPAFMSLVTPTPACTGGTACERRPTRTIVDREAGLHGIAIREVAVAAAVVVVPFGCAASGGAPRWADGSRTHSGGRHRHEPARVSGPGDSGRHPGRYGRRHGAALLAGLIPSCAIGSLLALAVGLVDRLGASRLRGCWGDRHRGADSETT